MPAGRVAGKAGYSNHYYNGKGKINLHFMVFSFE